MWPEAAWLRTAYIPDTYSTTVQYILYKGKGYSQSKYSSKAAGPNPQKAVVAKCNGGEM
jgi:hypothetical protein